MAEFPDIFACFSCEKALFVDEEDRASTQFACPFCQHEHTPGDVLGLDESEDTATEGVAAVGTAAEESSEGKPAGEPPLYEPAERPKEEKEEDVELLVDDPSKPEPETENESNSVAEEARLEGDDVEQFIKEPSEAESEEEPGKDLISEEAKVAIEVPDDLELPDVFACLSCENALFLDETERKSGDFSCPHCGQKNGAAKTRLMAAEQLATVEEVTASPVPEHKFDELIECPGCEKAIKLMPEERDESSVNCPYCKIAIGVPAPPVVEESSEEAEPAESSVGEAAQEEGAPEAEMETPKPEAEEETGQLESGATPDPEEASLAVDEQGQTSFDETALKAELEEGGEADLLTDEEAEGESTGEDEPEEAVQEVDRDLLASLIESSRNQSLMPESFACTKCETEIELPEVERQIGVCFCPECEELIDSKTAYENTPDEPEPVDSEQPEEGEAEAPDGVEALEAGAEEGADEDGTEQDATASQEEVAAESEFWINGVLPSTVDCSKCSNSLKLENEEKMFGIYLCPYCKTDINHAKGTVVEWLITKLDNEEEEEELVPKRKQINLKALLPYAAVLVFGVVLNYGVIAVTGYIQEKKALKAQWVLQLKSDWVELEQQPEVFDRALSNASNKASIARLEEMSMDELKEFHEHLLTERKDAYAIWFEDTARDDITADSRLGPIVERFRGKLDRFMRRVQLAKIDADNLKTAIGMSSFERQRADELLDKHMAAIRDQMHGLSAERAVDKALVRPELLADLMKFNLMVDQFEMQSIRQAVADLDSMIQLASLIDKQYDLNRPTGDQSLVKDPGGGHLASSGHKEEPSAHASHGDEHSEPSAHEEEPAGHASRGDDHSEPSGHKEEAVTHTSHGDDHSDQSGHGHSSHASVKPGTLWNAEVFHWQAHRAKRVKEYQPQWDEVVAEYENLLDLLSGFDQELKALRDGANISQLDHPFLDTAVLRSKVDEFRELEGVGTLVSHDVVVRLERLAKLLDPYATGSLAGGLNIHKALGVNLTHEQAGQFYERFWEEWKKFHLEKQWFKLEGISAYYHLAKYDSTSSAKAHH